MSPAALGVDGWRGRWVAARLDGRSVSWQVHDTFAELLADRGPTVVAVDMPITVADGPRASDIAARAYLRELGGPPSSIFLTPTAWTVAAWEAGLTHAEAMRARPPGAAGTSIQAWHLIASMVQLRDALAAHPEATVIEAHPECSFRTIEPRIGGASKKTGLGVGLRLRALRTVFDLDLAEAPAGVPVDDLLDAVAVLWTAQRFARGACVTIPGRPGGEPPIHV